MDELALFAGAGGGILGGHLLGWRTRCAVELDPHARKVLLARQRDGYLPRFPIWDDVQTFDGKPWRGLIDVVTGGFPCQDISTAGRGAGITGKKSGLWSEMARIVDEVGPRFVLVENSAMLTSRGLGTVLGDLASMGFDASWGVLGAYHAGAPHKRHRIWILASCRMVADPSSRPHQIRGLQAGRKVPGCRGEEATNRQPTTKSRGSHSTWWETEPDVGRMADGVAHRMDRLRAIGNGQVPAVAAAAWRILRGGEP